MSAAIELTPKAERTRAAILASAERLFAERGFRGTRLEDVAAAVGIRRASIVYYFRGKAELYDAVLGDALGGLLDQLREALVAEGSLGERIEAAVSVWVAYLGGRPNLARLLLRDAVEAEPGSAPGVVAHTKPFRALAESMVDQAGAASSSASGIDAAHLASAIAGATLFFLGAMPALVPDLEFNPSSPEHLEAHRQELLRITRRLLGEDAS
ncbi:MAG: TetR/AcrR family transcriptional regulator [Deltaproteobacteria bacterium]|nr:TetR/AcrR family transcriptional regulator [Deltaproteobacteria bacterium]MBW2392927.1 TetR/AcrR family transcriptional regulator [Deltaproteobacteria bacterium]